MLYIMHDKTVPGVEIAVCPAPRRAEVLRLVFARAPDDRRDEQIAALLKRGKEEPDLLAGLVEARDHGRLVGATWIQPEPGRTAIAWPPRMADDAASDELAAALLDAALGAVASQPIRLLQALVATDTDADARRLVAAGFEHLADLLYLVSTSGSFPVSRPPCALTYEAYSAENHQRLARVVLATYAGSRDCPRLDGVRQIDDVLEGYRATGAFDPSRWLLARHAGQDVGCLLLADHAADDQWELVYMGILPEYRGHGWGIEIVRYGQWLTRCAGRQRLVLAVDADNQPAIDVYAAAGFQGWDRRSAFVRTMSIE